MKISTPGPRSVGRAGVLAVVLALLAAIPVLGDDAAPSLARLQATFQQQRELARAPLTELETLYEGQLDALRKKLREAGELDKVLLVDKEKSGFRDREETEEEAFPELERLRTIYREEVPRREAAVQKRLSRYQRAYADQLDALAVELTRQDRLEEAVKARDEARKIRASLANGDGNGDAGRVMEGVISFMVKGEAALYHNGDRVAFRDDADREQYVAGQSQPREIHSGDHIVLQVRHPYVFRGFVLGIQSREGEAEIAVKREHWRIVPAGTHPGKVTAEQLQDSHLAVGPGRFDHNGKALWESFGLAQPDAGGSQWVQTDERDAPVTYGFVLAPDMFPGGAGEE